jgi:hypothetical protein
VKEPRTAEDPENGGSAAQQIEDLLTDRRLDGVVRTVQARHPSASFVRVQDAVLTVIARLVANGHGPARNIEHLLVIAAGRELVSQWRKTHREHLREPGDGHLDTAAAEPSSEEKVVLGEAGKDGLRWLLRHVRAWDNRGHALVVEIYLTAALEDEVLTPEEVAELIAVPLDQEVRPGTVAVWKTRGFARLREELGDIVSIPDSDDPDSYHPYSEEQP